MLLEKLRLGQPSRRVRGLTVGWLMALSSLAASCGHAAETADHDAGPTGPCLPGPDGSIGGPPPDDCPNDIPSDTDCPGASPSYQNDIAPIVQQRCTVCHAPGGIETSKLFGSYAQVHDLRVTMLNFIYHCQMPPTCAPQLTPDERQKLLKWFVCKALDN